MRELCDKKDCGAPAFVSVMLSTGVLEFCQHHGNEVVEALDPASVVVVMMPVPA